MQKLLFVCLGNICRSPAAENVMVNLVEKAGLSTDIHCDSAGTASYHIGSPPDARMVKAGRARGLAMFGRGRQFTHADFEAFDLILAMDRANYANICALDPQGRYRHKVRLMLSYGTRYGEIEVPDPYYGGSEGFEHVLDLLYDACQGLLEQVRHVDHPR